MSCDIEKWPTYQSIPNCKKDKCSFQCCPGLKLKVKKKYGRNMCMECKQCTAANGGVPVYFSTIGDNVSILLPQETPHKAPLKKG